MRVLDCGRSVGRCVLAAGAIGGSLLGASAPSARANVVKAMWVSPQVYAYEIKHMPDFDQIRDTAGGVAGLPADGGMYCVPTSAINLMAYAANHGFPFIEPGDKPWWATSNAARYNEITADIAWMGALMGTDAQDGTDGAGNRNGVTAWLAVEAPGLFTVTHQFGAGYWSPRISDVAFKSLTGGISNLCYGRYDIMGSFGNIPMVQRTGGHCVTLVGATQSGGQSQILVRDPADVPNDTVQLAFTNREWDGSNFVIAGFDSPGGPALNIRTVTRLDAPGTTNLRFIDSYLSIKPKYGLSFSNEVIPPKIELVSPKSFAATPAVFPGSSAIPGVLRIDELDQAPDLESVAVVGLIDGVKGVGVLSSSSNAFTVLDLDAGLKDAAYGRFRELYVAVGQRLDCYDLDAPVVSAIPLPWPFPPTGVAFSDFDDTVHTVARFGTQVGSIAARFPAGVGPVVRPLPGGLPIGAEPQILASPVDGTIWVWSDQSPRVFQFALNGMGTAWQLINAAEIDGCTPRDVSIGDGGFLFLICDGSVRELRPVTNATGGIDWQVFEQSPFHGMPAAGGFVPEMSRTNYNPAEHGVPGWTDNILPGELQFGTPIVDCVADLDGDRDIDSDDLSMLLGSFGLGYAGDLDADQDTDSDDLGLMLGVFGQDCP